MLNIVLLIALGAFIGWNIPQPPWAKYVQAKITKMVGTLKAKMTKPPANNDPK